MRKLFSSIIWAALALAGPVAAQSCDSLILDQEKILGSDQAAILAAAAPLTGKAYELHILTVAQARPMQDALKRFEREQCPSWSAADGQQKSNILLLGVSKSGRSMGVLFAKDGPVGAALNSTYPQINAVMLSSFRHGDFAGGFVAGLNKANDLLQTYEHPVSREKTIIDHGPATDYQPIGHAVEVIFSVLLLIGLGLMAIILVNRRRLLRQEREKAQRDAIFAQNAASDELTKARAELDDYRLLGSTTVSEVQGIVDSALDAYNRLAGTESTNPNTPGLSDSGYQAIAGQYRDVVLQAQQARRLMKYGKGSVPKPAARSPREAKSSRQPAWRDTAQQPAAQRPASAPTPERTVVVTNNSNNGFTEGLLLGDLLGRDSSRSSEPSVTPSSRNSESSWSTSSWSRSSSDEDSSRKSSNDGGSSFSWSSSDSSSSNDSGGSSSFDSFSSSSDNSGGGGGDW